MDRPQSKSIPTTPGVYVYKDIQGRMLYVGKARNLRKRVLSYFREKGLLTPKTSAMMQCVYTLETLSTTTEKEALLLESSLIKKHHPRYNIVLRDDKQYVLFCIQRDIPFPRLEIVRQAKKDNAQYFGPFTSASAVRETWKFIHRVFPLRRCSDRVFKNRVRPCLYFYLGQCLAPCTEHVDPKVYAVLVQRVELFLSGRSQELIEILQHDMFEASNNLDFERAALLRDQIQSVRQTVEKQSVVLSDGGDIDVIGISVVGNGLGLGCLFVREGKLLDGRTFFWPGLELEDGPELLISFLGQFYGTASSMIPPRIVIPWLPESEGESEDIHKNTFDTLKTALVDIHGGAIRIGTPRNTSEASLIDIAVTNAREAAQIQVRESISVKLAKVFHRDKPIIRIECVDVSHTGGTNTRIGMVVFEDGQPLKHAYRTYQLKEEEISMVGGDDYAALASWVRRRRQSKEPWPDLLLIDGGRGQISAVQSVLNEENIQEDFVLAGIAKARNPMGRVDRRAGNLEDKIFLSGRSNPLSLKAGSQELLFLQHVRDTAHHFVIGKHRKARGKAALLGELTRIPSVGQATAKLLWNHFTSIEAMSCATEEDLQAIPGIGVAKAESLVKRLKLLHK